MLNLDEINQFCNDSLISNLGIQITYASPELVEASMPVDNRTIQPFKYLHGGASVALAETVGSLGSFLAIDPNEFNVFGMEIKANHIKPATEGKVFATARLIHKGKTTHLWDIEILNDQKEAISLVRMTNMVVKKQN